VWPNLRFSINGDGTVTDNLTGLIWLENANCNGTMTWENALTWANILTTGHACDSPPNLSDGSSAGDWRLPNYFELVSLLDLAYADPALSNEAGTDQWSEGDAFSGVQSDVYWSSTTYAGNTGNAWYVGLNVGYVGAYDKGGNTYVWPVRGGQ